MHLSTRKEQFSIAHMRCLAAVCGLIISREEVDIDSVDVGLSRAGGRSPELKIQLKCSAALEKRESDFSFTLSMKNYNDLRRSTLVPRMLVVLEVPGEEAMWLSEADDHLILRHSVLVQPARNARKARSADGHYPYPVHANADVVDTHSHDG